MTDNCRWREEEEGTTQARENTRVREENRTIDNYPWPMFFIGVQMFNILYTQQQAAKTRMAVSLPSQPRRSRSAAGKHNAC